MAVYTHISSSQLRDFTAYYDIGEIISCIGIVEGIENTNFLLTTSTGRFILTIFEKRVQTSDLPFYLGLMDYLSLKGFPCARPVQRKDGKIWGKIEKKSAALITFVSGQWPKRINLNHCLKVGHILAKLHITGSDFKIKRKNNLSVETWQPLLKTCLKQNNLSNNLKIENLAGVIEHLENNWPNNLPTGPIHGDLFPDNVLFHKKYISGVIDFYFASTDAFAYDLAISLNAWCFDEKGRFFAERARALINSYTEVRKLNSRELEAIPIFATGASVRFLLTRIYDWFNGTQSKMSKKKDPMPYVKRLEFHLSSNTLQHYGLD